MKQKQYHIMAALLALCLLPAACGGERDHPAGPVRTAAYTADTVPLGLPLMELTASAAGEGSLYLAGTEEAPEEGEDGEITSSGSFSFSSSGSDDGSFTFFSGAGSAALYRMDAASGELTKLEGYAPGEGASVAAIVPCEDGALWVLERTAGGMEALDLDALERGGAWKSQVWRKLDATGAQELDRVDMAELAGKLGVETVSDTRMDREGRLYAAAGTSVTALDTGLSVLFTCKGLETVERLVPLYGGVGVLTRDENGRAVYPIEPESRSLGTARPLTGSAGKFYGGNEVYDFFYTSGDSLYGWAGEAAMPEKLLSWSGAGVDKGKVEALALQPDGSGTALLREGGVWPAGYLLARLTPAGEDALADRTVLTLATMGLDSETRTRVLEFNRTNGKYRIEVRDYSEYNTADDASAGLSKLNTEILAGDMPDLLDVSGVSLRRYAARGLLEDLWPYIEADPELGRGKVMERPLEAAEVGGKLYQVFPRFTIETAAGAPAAVGDKMGWTLEELRAALAKQPAGCSVLGPDETRESVLETMFGDSLDAFVDWETGKASFDSPEFQAILEFCASLPAQTSGGEADDDYTRVANGEQLLLPVSLNDLQSVQLYRSLLGGGVTFAGYPGGSAVRFQAENGMAMSASCRDKEGAWRFLRQALLPGGEDFIIDFPVNREEFQRKTRVSMEPAYLKDENGNAITGPDGGPMLEGCAFVFVGGRSIMLKPAGQEDYDQVMALYEAADALAGRDENIWSIVRECAGACFAGDRTAADAARDIQNRVELYLNEQR